MGSIMLTNAQRKLLVSLHRKKGRHEHGLFLVEGTKAVEELLASGWGVDLLLATEAWPAPPNPRVSPLRVGEGDLAKLSALDTPSPVLAVARMPAPSPPAPPRGRILALDGIQDPGNLGTLLRAADWFGLDRVVCSPDCVDLFNPKTVQASMGSLFRVAVELCPLPDFLRDLPESFWRAGAFLGGENLYGATLPDEGVLVLGNEGRGIREEVAALLPQRLSIPGFGGAESLNVAMAGALFAAEWRRGELIA